MTQPPATNPLHPQRCKTCKSECTIRIKTGDRSSTLIDPKDPSNTEYEGEVSFFIEMIKSVGCASHSAASPLPTAPALFQIEPNSENYTLRQIVEINENIQKQRKEAAAQARADVLKLAAEIWGVAVCVKKENTDDFMEYFSERMGEFEKRYESLRQPKEQP